MRLRNVKGSRDVIASSQYVIQEPESVRGSWKESVFKNSNPIHLEIGMGKGQFLQALASANPDINYIGIEKYSSVLIRAIQKREENDFDNLYFLRFDATGLCDIFADGEIDRIYLNFSDPWPKDRHAKRRLTSPDFLALYDKVLCPDGFIQFKTDNRDLFNYSVEVAITSEKWHIDELTYDLQQSEFAENNVMTEYEAKFTALGHPICRMVLSRR
ncbi:MAG: tRNA (guanosine(46)-N7)-methyltransferase TrmB [Eubacterium sp.]|nr:tRNA (guanosine(46)-N7)-methyltransferase TrmB [Eubacterium sp.]